MKPVDFHPDAILELDEAAAWYDQRQPGLGSVLLRAVERTVKSISVNPLIGVPYKSDFRFKLVRRFPYVVFYLNQDDRIWIAAVAHGRRRPDYWKRRKPP